MSKQLKYRLTFFGSAEPFVVPLIKATTVRSMIREGVSMIAGMDGWIQVYNIDKLSLELTKRNMSTSIFLTTVAQTFRSKSFDPFVPMKMKNRPINNEDDVWLFCGHDDVRTKRLPGILQRGSPR